MRFSTILAATIVAAPALGFAEDAAKEEKRNWEAAAELGYVSTNGNTKTTTINAKLGGKYKANKWTHSGSFESHTAEDDNDTTAEKYTLKAKSQRNLSEANYLYGGFSYEDDRFSGYDYQLTVSGGYGRRIVHTDTTEFDLEIGPGYRYSNPIVGDDEEEGVLHLGLEFNHKISKTSSFSQELFTDIGDDNTISQSITSVTAKVAEALALKVGFNAKHTSEVPEGTEELDTKTSVTLVYSF